MCVCVCVCVFSCIQLFATPVTVALQAPLSMGFSRKEYWSRLPFPTPGDPTDPGTEPISLACPALAGEFFTMASPGKFVALSFHLVPGNVLYYKNVQIDIQLQTFLRRKLRFRGCIWCSSKMFQLLSAIDYVSRVATVDEDTVDKESLSHAPTLLLACLDSAEACRMPAVQASASLLSPQLACHLAQKPVQ